MGGAYGKHNMKCTEFLFKNLKGRDHLGDLSIDRRILKWIEGYEGTDCLHPAQLVKTAKKICVS
jgi:hypothetical protein